MHLRNYSIIVIILLSFSSLFAQTQIAVIDFEGLGVATNDAKALTNRLMIEMHRTNKFIVLEREMLDKIIEEQKFQLSGCNSDQCLVELGKIANVHQILAGSISRVGDVYSISARLISVETGEVVTSGLYDSEGEIGDLMKAGMASIATQIASPLMIPRIEQSNTTLKTNSSRNSSETVIDFDGNVYGTVQIGGQVWMAENLKVTHYRNGDAITKVTTDVIWEQTFSEAYCNYDFNDVNANTYGSLYNWYSINDSRNIAPDGWHVPSDDEWKQLEMFIGISTSNADQTDWRGTNEGEKLKASTGFNAQPAGYRHYEYGFLKLDSDSYFWSSLEYLTSLGAYRRLDTSHSSIYRYFENKRSGLSVRCVKD